MQYSGAMDIIIYRFEDAEGRGPYTSNLTYWTCPGISRITSEMHPVPCDDEILDYGREHRYGFSSKEQLLAWFGFPGCLDSLEELDFKIAMYLVDTEHVLFGEKQVAFVGDEAFRMTEISYADLRSEQIAVH